MRKREFLRELSNRISHIEKTERDNIINYYDELIEDTIERSGETEEQVIYNLGTLNDIVRRLNLNNINNNYKRIVVDDILEEEMNKPKINDAPKQEAIKEETTSKSMDKEEKVVVEEVKETPKKKMTNKQKNALIIVLVAVITFPIWISVVSSVLGVTIGLLAAGLGIAIGCVVTSIALVVSGVVAIIAGVSLISSVYGILLVGAGFILIGLGFLLAPVVVKFCVWVFKIYWKAAKWLVKFVNNLFTSRKKVDSNEN